MYRFFSSLRGKLTLTYTLVTVLVLLALEALALCGGVAIYGLMEADQRDYAGDVINVLNANAARYLQPGAQDLPGLQAWLDRLYASGYASVAPQNWLDSPAAPIVQGEPISVLSAEGVVLARVPGDPAGEIGQRYAPPNLAGAARALERALAGELGYKRLTVVTPGGGRLMAVPVLQGGPGSELLGVIVLTIETPPPPPALWSRVWPAMVWVLLVTGVVLLVGVAPLGMLFGFVMSRGLTRRLQALAAAADAWSKGDFRLLPEDRSHDEIGHLGMRLRNMAERIQGLLQTRRELAMMEERNRLARELHDTVKQQAFATLMQVRAARNLLTSDPAAAAPHLEEAEALIRTSQQDLGRMIAELRPAALDGQGLAKALRAYAETWSQQAHVPVTFSVQNDRRLPLDVEQALYRLAQEAFSNVARHSHASLVQVRLDYAADQVRLTVADNGVGFDSHMASESGFGLQSMRERAEALGGILLLQSVKGAGTTLTAIIPLSE
ncbi:MAG TPA: histidine kinase [Anaerolineae bacterium]|nr:histidine kinase [Anaerolineae bacterium]HPL29154.1 histidine kinase [Anaerolineae bacterium]